MMCVGQEKATKLADAQGYFDSNNAKASFKRGRGIGQVGRPSDVEVIRRHPQMARMRLVWRMNWPQAEVRVLGRLQRQTNHTTEKYNMPKPIRKNRGPH